MVQHVDDPIGAAAAAGLEGRESGLFGRVPWYSLGLLFGTRRPAGRQSTPARDWMVA